VFDYVCVNDTGGSVMDTPEVIQQAVGSLDCQRIHEIMRWMNWEWLGTGVPSAQAIRREAKDHLMKVYGDSKYRSSESGGLRAERFFDSECQMMNYRVLFIAEQSSADEFQSSKESNSS